MAKNRAEKRRAQRRSGQNGGTVAAPRSTGIVERWKAFLSGKSPIFNFLVRFLGVLLPFYVLWSTAFFKNYVLATWNEINTWLASFVLNIFGAGTEAIGDRLVGPSASLQVFEGCDGIEPTMLLVAGIIAFPAARRHKLRGLLYGSLFILGLNFVRILSLYVVAVAWPAGFEFMHIEFWQVVFILIAVLVWLYWISKSAPQAVPQVTSDDETVLAESD